LLIIDEKISFLKLKIRASFHNFKNAIIFGNSEIVQV